MRSLSLFILMAWSLGSQAEEPLGKIIFTNFCFTCHGMKGEGNAQLKAPSIAGTPAWYLDGQLRNFREDRRGFDPSDVEGQLMSASAKALNAEQSSAVSEYVASLKRVPPVATVAADRMLGRELYRECCMECHRFNGEGEMVFGSPPLVGLQDWYLMAQIQKFRHGLRGVLTADAMGQKMAFSARFIESENALEPLVAYIISLQSPAKDEMTDPFDQALLSGQK